MVVTPETTVVRDERGLPEVDPPRPPRRPLRRPRSSCCLATGAAMTDEAARTVAKVAAANRILMVVSGLRVGKGRGRRTGGKNG